MKKYRIFKTDEIEVKVTDLKAGAATLSNEWDNHFIAEYDSLEEARNALKGFHTEVQFVQTNTQKICLVSEYFIEVFGFESNDFKNNDIAREEYNEQYPIGDIDEISKMEFVVTEDKDSNDEEDLIGICETFDTYKDASDFCKKFDNICNIVVEC